MSLCVCVCMYTHMKLSENENRVIVSETGESIRLNLQKVASAIVKKI